MIPSKPVGKCDQIDDLLCLVSELQEEVANGGELQNLPERDWSMELYSALSDAWKTTEHACYGKRSRICFVPGERQLYKGSREVEEGYSTELKGKALLTH